MDQKTWLPRKRSIVVKSEAGTSIKGNEGENLPYNKEAALEETVKNLHEQVACLVCECNAKDELMAEHMKTTQEVITGRKKAESRVAIYKQDLEDTLQQKLHTNKRLVHLNASLKNCRQELSSLKVEQEERVNMERANKRLESKYKEARKKLANLTLENAQLTKAFVKKDESIKNVSDQMSKATTEYYHLLKRELKIRTVNADVANRQHQETANLEAERQRLRLLVKKRVPGHGKTNKSMSLVIKKLSEVEEENRTLKESLCEKEKEVRNLKAEIERNPKIMELENKIVSLELEVERENESKRTTEDYFDNLKLMNVDLDHQLSASKVEIKEAFRKVSVLEMELEDKSQQYEGLETTCLELQLQLATVSSRNEETEDVEQKKKAIQTLSCYKELETTELTNNKKSSQHSSLGDLLNSPTIKEILTATETKDPSVPHYNTCNSSCGLKNVVPQALSIVPRMKRSKGIELLWKLVLRRKKGGSKKKVHRLGKYHV